ncbi:MAG: hypothetical protein V9E87_11750 [Gemmatimonadales bacterium]
MDAHRAVAVRWQHRVLRHEAERRRQRAAAEIGERERIRADQQGTALDGAARVAEVGERDGPRATGRRVVVQRDGGAAEAAGGHEGVAVVEREELTGIAPRREREQGPVGTALLHQRGRAGRGPDHGA